ncbi:hypothetical protein E2C01_056403 [Portunus trituberculatus]|uniref:Uncharacterized protein n=1 Tax=Portunus trituberculatus TaxID=210409 RepID=A0A5B7GXL8_PORTR|nr:hypothetical protein [Portunus trituberculatus]
MTCWYQLRAGDALYPVRDNGQRYDPSKKRGTTPKKLKNYWERGKAVLRSATTHSCHLQGGHCHKKAAADRPRRPLSRTLVNIIPVPPRPDCRPGLPLRVRRGHTSNKLQNFLLRFKVGSISRQIRRIFSRNPGNQYVGYFLPRMAIVVGARRRGSRQLSVPCVYNNEFCEI